MHFLAKPFRGGGPGVAPGLALRFRMLASFTLAFEGERFRGVEAEVIEEMGERNRQGR